jgi:hypothetical protein
MRTIQLTRAIIGGHIAALLVACYSEPTPRPPPRPEECSERSRVPAGAEFEDLETVPYGPVKSNVMLLVDRSGSMNDTGACSGPECDSKWDQLLALGPYLEQIRPHVRMGLAVYPSPGYGACGVTNGILEPIAEDPDVARRILDALESTSPGGATPTADALLEMAETGGLDDPDRNNVIVLFTDGRPTCACGGEVECERAAAIAAVEALRYQYDPPIKVYVIGFGASAIEEADETLTAMAIAAGSARDIPDEPVYHQAESIEELITRAYEVGYELQDRCTFQLCQEPHPDRLVVAVDGRMLEACSGDCEDGYRFDPAQRQVRILGRACEALEDGSAHELWLGERQ